MYKIIFLHIPKTAGQSVHAFFETSFSRSEILPARVNFQLNEYSFKELNQYKIFSGHMDWNKLASVNGLSFVFTILREPMERLLSYYFYLRKKAEKLSAHEIEKPQNQGMRAILSLTPDEYFCGTNEPIRTFVDNHYDNFYTYFFCGKTYDSRQFILKEIGKSKKYTSMDDVLERSLENMKLLDRIYDISNWTELYTDIQMLYPDIQIPKGEIFTNKGDGNSLKNRLNDLKKLGATQKTFDRLNEFCKYDNIIYDYFIKDIK